MFFKHLKHQILYRAPYEYLNHPQPLEVSKIKKIVKQEPISSKTCSSMVPFGYLTYSLAILCLTVMAGIMSWLFMSAFSQTLLNISL